MQDPLNDPLTIWFKSSMPPPYTIKQSKYHAGQIVIESEVYAKRVASEFMLGLSTGLTYSGVTFRSTSKSFLIIWESRLPKKTKDSLGTILHHLSDTYQSFIAKSYANLIEAI